MLRHLFSDPYVCTIVIINAIYSINIVYTKPESDQTKDYKIIHRLAFVTDIYRISQNWTLSVCYLSEASSKIYSRLINRTLV